VRAIEHDAERDAVTARAARGRVRGLERRIDRAYRSRIEQDLDALDRRIEDAYREVEMDATIAVETTEARRLRVVVYTLVILLLVLIGILLLGVL